MQSSYCCNRWPQLAGAHRCWLTKCLIKQAVALACQFCAVCGFRNPWLAASKTLASKQPLPRAHGSPPTGPRRLHTHRNRRFSWVFPSRHLGLRQQPGLLSAFRGGARGSRGAATSLNKHGPPHQDEDPRLEDGAASGGRGREPALARLARDYSVALGRPREQARH